MKTFDLDPNYYGEDSDLQLPQALTIEPGLTLLVGPNGTGKTTILKQIEKQLRDTTTVITYNNLSDGGVLAREKSLHYGDVELFATQMASSEGQNIRVNLGRVAGELGQVLTNPDHNDVWVLLDAVDSGMSVDLLDEVKEGFLKVALTLATCRLYIVVATNSYELVRGERFLDITTGDYHEPFKDYEDFRKFILRHSRLI